ncbi:MAG: hypothetical protein WKH64_05215 [Chloroflexia bacterium]
MAQEFFTPGTSVAVVTLDNPLATDDDELIVLGFVVERDATGILLDSGVPEVGMVYIPWTNIAQIAPIEISPDDLNGDQEDRMTY